MAAIASAQAPLYEIRIAGNDQLRAADIVGASGLHNMEGLLRRDGYLNVSSRPSRSFHEKESVVDLTVQVRKGQQFLFAALRINGFSPELERKAHLWMRRTRMNTSVQCLIRCGLR